MITPNPIIQSLEAYTPGEQPQGSGYIKLNTNEFPYPAAPELLLTVRQAITDDVRLYPSPRCEGLRSALAEYHALPANQIFVGNGSDEVLRLLIQSYGGRGRNVAVVNPSYSLYPTLIHLAESGIKVFELDDSEQIPASLSDSSWDMVLLPVPNPPIGTVFPRADLQRLARKVKLLVIDEAYADFSDEPETGLGLMREFENVVLTRTFSKSFGLAGMRVGYALGHPEIIANLSKAADSYNVNRISQVAAVAAIRNAAYYKEKVNQIKSDRDWLRGELIGLGFTVPRSQGNFLFARHSQAQSLYESLKARKILVRYFSNEKLRDGVRITIGTRAELERLLSEIKALLKA